MFDLLAIIYQSALTLMIFLSRPEWKQSGNRPESALKSSRSDVIEDEDKEGFP